MNKVIVYTACRMTGRFMDELVQEATTLKRVLENYGYEVMNPVIEEKVVPVHEVLEQIDPARLDRYWQRDKECLKDCHIVLDYKSCNKSDGVGVELALSRFCYWKPTLRVFPTAGICISRIEYDEVFYTLEEALLYMQRHYRTKHQLLWWRIKMLLRSFPAWTILQMKFLWDLLW